MQLVLLLHHCLLSFVQAAARLFVLLLRLGGALRLPLVLEDNARINTVLVHARGWRWHALRLVLLSQVVAEVSAARVVLSIFAALSELGALHLLMIYLDLFLVLISHELRVIAVILLLCLCLLRCRQTSLNAIIGQLRLDEIHLWSELRGLPELRIALRGSRAAERLAILVLDESRLARVLADARVCLLHVPVVVE